MNYGIIEINDETICIESFKFKNIKFIGRLSKICDCKFIGCDLSELTVDTAFKYNTLEKTSFKDGFMIK